MVVLQLFLGAQERTGFKKIAGNNLNLAPTDSLGDLKQFLSLKIYKDRRVQQNNMQKSAQWSE